MRAFLLLPLLAACAVPEEGPGDGAEPRGLPSIFAPPEPEAPPAPPPLPPAVLAALPPGTPPSIVLQDGAGCYLYSIERTDPPSGYPLRDAAGVPICEGSATLASAGIVAGDAPPGVTDATPLPSAATDGVLDAGDLALPPLGDITPPAPLAPLN